ncbi:MAG TPA: hypothetical protein VNA89_12950, partial [Gemmatimonadaceae bacterium]|nr:hypothetical protein [Gemmatimonadaceae bacterium]
PTAEATLAVRSRLRGAQALDAAGRRDEALAQSRTVLARPHVYDSHEEARRGLKEPYKLQRRISEATGEAGAREGGAGAEKSQ